MSKVAFIHLSDIHVKTDSNIGSISKLIIDSINNYIQEADTIFVVFTGDMTKTCEKNQFAVFDKFIENVLVEIKRKTSVDAKALIIPGNHDISLTGRKYPLKELIKATEDKKEQMIVGEINHMKDALKLCKKHGCFLDNVFLSKIIFKRNNINYSFYLLNSSPFSSLDKNDKEHHFIPKENFDVKCETKYGEKNVNILLMHHRPDWFDESTSEQINSFIRNNISIVFYGHEHAVKTENLESSNRSIMFNGGGELIAKGNNTKGEFGLMILNEDTMQSTRYTFSLDYLFNKFIEQSAFSKEIEAIEILPLSKQFKERFYKSPLQDESGTVLDIFVMPSIMSSKNTFEFPSLSDFVKEIKKKKIVAIEGSSRSGKTMLLKALFSCFQKETPCVYLTINSETNDNGKQLVKMAVTDMYDDDNNNITRINSFDKNTRAIFVDEFDKIRKADAKKKLLSYFKDNFGMVVITYSKNENPKSYIQEADLLDSDNIYKNYGITAKGRKQLVEKLCTIKGVEQEYVSVICQLYERELNGVGIFDLTDPGYGLLYLEGIINQKLYLERNTNNSFSVTFESYIFDLLICAGSREKLDDYVSVLNLLSFNVWDKNKGIIFDEEDIHDAHKKCRDEGWCSLSFSECLSTFTDSSIIIRCDDGYRFKRNSYLSYFISNELIKRYNSGDEKSFQKLIDEITVGLNSDILLFVLFTIKNVTIIKEISKRLSYNFKDIDPINFSDNKNLLFKSDTSLPDESEDNKLSKVELENRKDNKEKQTIIIEKQNELKAFEDKNFTDDEKMVIETMKMIEIVSKSISGFKSLFSKQERKELFDIAYSALLRVLSFSFNFTNDDIIQIEKDFEEYKKNKIERLEIEQKSKKEIESLKNMTASSFLYGLLIEHLTLLESFYAYLIVSPLITEFIDNLPNSVFENDVLKLYYYVFSSNAPKFIQQLKFVKNNYPSNKIDNLTQFFARIYIVHNNFKSSDFDAICSVSEIKKEKMLPYATREGKMMD